MFEPLKENLIKRGVISKENFLIRSMAYAAIAFLTVFVAQQHSRLGQLYDTSEQEAAAIQSALAEVPSIGLTDPSLSLGLSSVTDYNENIPYLDIIHTGRAFYGSPRGKPYASYTNQMLRDGGYLDAQGWPKAIPPELSQVEMIWAFTKDEKYGGASARAGTYVVTYEGEGTIKMQLDAKLVSTATGTIIFTTTGSTFTLAITQTDPRKVGNNIRNISVVKQEYVPLVKAGAIFNPEYIAKIKDARQVRFKDAMSNDNSGIKEWSQMPTETSIGWSPMPMSLQVRLANEIGADPWFTVPYHASDDFIRNYATYVRDNLDPKLVATVEFSNEVWNFGFEQSRAAIADAEKEYGVKGGPGWVNYYGQRASQVMKIWTEVFGAETKTRLIRAAGVQTAYVALTPHILDAPMWKAAKPKEYVAPSTYFDAIAVTTYFGGNFIQSAALFNPVLALPIGDAQNELHKDQIGTGIKIAGTVGVKLGSKYATTSLPLTGVGGFTIEGVYYPVAGVSGATTTFTFQEGAWTKPSLTYRDVSYWSIESTIAATERFLQQNKEIAKARGLKMIAYEGGQHVHHSAFTAISTTTTALLQPHLTDFVRSNQMADLYEQIWNVWKKVGDGPFMQFTDVGQPSKYGSWGLYASLKDNNPRAERLMKLNASTPAWFENRSGSHFTQGLVLTATNSSAAYLGTMQEDYLIGTSGSDIFYPGRGDDGVYGGEGIDKVYFKGNKAEYTVTRLTTGYRIKGKEGSDYVNAVELLVFSDGTIDISSSATPLDSDEDSVLTETDNCLAVFNLGQEDFDKDKQGDACDTDDDNDGILDTAEKTNCQFNSDLTCSDNVKNLNTLASTTAAGSPKLLSTTTPAAGPAVRMSFSSNQIYVGASSVISWSATGAVSCTASDSWSGNKNPVSGSENLGVFTTVGTRPYTLVCVNKNGGVTRSTYSLFIRSAPTSVATTAATTTAVTATTTPVSVISTVTFSSSTFTMTLTPDTVVLGAKAKLTWSAPGASGCTASGAWSGAQVASGQTEVSILSTTQNPTFVLTCTDKTVSLTKSKTLKVTVPVPTNAATNPSNGTPINLGVVIKGSALAPASSTTNQTGSTTTR